MPCTITIHTSDMGVPHLTAVDQHKQIPGYPKAVESTEWGPPNPVPFADFHQEPPGKTEKLTTSAVWNEVEVKLQDDLVKRLMVAIEGQVKAIETLVTTGGTGVISALQQALGAIQDAVEKKERTYSLIWTCMANSDSGVDAFVEHNARLNVAVKNPDDKQPDRMTWKVIANLTVAGDKIRDISKSDSKDFDETLTEYGVAALPQGNFTIRSEYTIKLTCSGWTEDFKKQMEEIAKAAKDLISSDQSLVDKGKTGIKKGAQTLLDLATKLIGKWSSMVSLSSADIILRILKPEALSRCERELAACLQKENSAHVSAVSYLASQILDAGSKPIPGSRLIAGYHWEVMGLDPSAYSFSVIRRGPAPLDVEVATDLSALAETGTGGATDVEPKGVRKP